jgi:membrane-associated HD superfamily phosphohydrolase
MSDNSNVQNNNQQILNDIQSLQSMEQQLVSSLESNPNLTSEQQQQIISKINQISNMRINLYKTLSGINSFFQTALSSSQNTLKEQTEVISIVENELNKSKAQLQLLQSEKDNKIRLVEINSYYGEKYAEHASLMKIIIFILLPVIVLTILYNNDILPGKIFYILIIIIAAIGGYFLWKTYISIVMRDTMNYQ